MKQKELKRLSRKDLLEMLLDLSKENEKLRADNGSLRKQLQDKTIAIADCGSLAEAALRLNGVFQAAEEACAQYTENIHSRSADLESHCRQMEEETKERCQKMEQETKAACAALLSAAREKAQSCLDEARQQKEAQDREYLWLAEIMNDGDSE